MKETTSKIKAKTILAIRFSAFGDVALTVSIVEQFLDQTDHKIVFVTNHKFVDLFPVHQNLTVVGVDLKEVKGLKAISSFAKQLLKNYKLTSIADFHYSLRSRIISNTLKLNGIREVVYLDKQKSIRKKLIKKGAISGLKLDPITHRYENVLKQLESSFKFNLSSPTYPPLLSDANNTKKIGIAPFAQHKLKIWEIDRMKQLVKKLSDENGYTILVFGSPSEFKLISDWSSFENVTFVIEKSLKEELDLIQSLDLMISMDSANLHLATLMQTSTLSIWGGTHPSLGYSPASLNSHIIQDENLSCRPCTAFGSGECHRGDFACMGNVTVKSVLSMINEILK